MTWKAAIAKAWTLRGSRPIIGAVLVAAVCGILIIVQQGIVRGLLYGPGLPSSALYFAPEPSGTEFGPPQHRAPSATADGRSGIGVCAGKNRRRFKDGVGDVALWSLFWWVWLPRDGAGRAGRTVKNVPDDRRVSRVSVNDGLGRYDESAESG